MFMLNKLFESESESTHNIMYYLYSEQSHYSFSNIL